MRIFNLDTILSFALYPDGNKKRNRHSQSYCLNVDQYSKNGCDETDSGTLKKHLKNLKVLCLGVLANESKNSRAELGAVKLRVKKIEKYEVDKEFLSPNENSPLPFFLFYKKKNVKATNELINISKPFFLEIIGLHKEKNLKLKKPEISREDITDINADYQAKVTQIAESIYGKIELSLPKVKIVGLFVDPCFIRKNDGKLFLEDTRPADALPRQNISIPQELNFLENSVNQALIGSESDSDDSSASIFPDDSNTIDIFSSQELISIKSIDEDDKSQSANAMDEFATDRVDGVQLEINEIINFVPLIDNQIVFAESKLENWNPETKKKITDLILVYQKHLTKKYCFRLDDFTESKKFITKKLLSKLSTNGTYESFFEYVYGVSTANILNKHRDLSIIQKIGQFFKRHNKTEGTLLLDNIFSMLNENNISINSRSV